MAISKYACARAADACASEGALATAARKSASARARASPARNGRRSTTVLSLLGVKGAACAAFGALARALANTMGTSDAVESVSVCSPRDRIRPA